jgi:hypothetical protein
LVRPTQALHIPTEATDATIIMADATTVIVARVFLSFITTALFNKTALQGSVLLWGGY